MDEPLFIYIWIGFTYAYGENGWITYIGTSIEEVHKIILTRNTPALIGLSKDDWKPGNDFSPDYDWLLAHEPDIVVPVTSPMLVDYCYGYEG